MIYRTLALLDTFFCTLLVLLGDRFRYHVVTGPNLGLTKQSDTQTVRGAVYVNHYVTLWRLHLIIARRA
jgi:hypothetical protein